MLTGRRDRMRVPIGTSYVMDRPKSPRNKPFIYRRYWTMNGWSKPSLYLSACRSPAWRGCQDDLGRISWNHHEDCKMVMETRRSVTTRITTRFRKKIRHLQK